MLSSKQTKCLELMAEGAYKDKDIAEMCGTTPQTLCNWKKKPEFQKAYTELIQNRIQFSAAKAYLKQLRLLESRQDMVSHLAAKDLLDRAGFKPEDRASLGIDMDLNVSVDYGDEQS